MTQKSFYKENNPCQKAILTGVACSKSGLLEHPHCLSFQRINHSPTK